MNELRANTFSDARIKDPKDSNHERSRDIQREVQKIRIFIRQSKYLENLMEQCSHTDISKTITLSAGLVTFTKTSWENIVNYLPRILKNETCKIKVKYSTEEEQKESEKIENCTISEIKQKIISLVDSFTNKELLRFIYKKEVAGKTKAVYIDF